MSDNLVQDHSISFSEGKKKKSSSDAILMQAASKICAAAPSKEVKFDDCNKAAEEESKAGHSKLVEKPLA